MDEQDKQTSGEPAEGEPTGVGQVVQSIARVTRQLPAPQDRRAGATVADAAQRERISTLIAALGDPEHPLHQRAVEDLVALGEAAVPALNESLRPTRPWLTSYRAAEVLGQIGDGRAAGPLLEALNYPNSNVRWSAVRALASVGDARAILELRRVARTDRGKTSWGEPVAGAAQSALDQMQSRNMLLRGADLIKTALACVLMLVGLIVAYSVVTTVREELARVASVPAGADAEPIVSTALPTETPPPTDVPLPTPLPAATGDVTPTADAATAGAPAAGEDALAGLVTASGNVRALPLRAGDNVIGGVAEGDQVLFVSVSPDGQWYRVRLGEPRAAGSRIDSPDGTGWISRSLVTEPRTQVPVEETAPPPEPTATPTP